MDKEILDFLKIFHASFVGHLAELRMHLVAGNALQAHYLALILKRLSGVEITKEIEDLIIEEIAQKYEEMCKRVYEADEAASRIEGLQPKGKN